MAKLPGSLRQRGPNSWQLRFEAGPPDEFGNRRQYSATVRGSRKDAVAALIAAIAAKGTTVLVPLLPEKPAPATEITRLNAPSIAEYMTDWLATTVDFSQKTRERYDELNRRQIIPQLGSVRLDRLTPKQVEAWHLSLRRGGGPHGRPLHPRTVGHAHRVLSRGYARAMSLELVTRNPLAAVRPPPVPNSEIAILSSSQIVELLERLRQSNNATKQRLYPIAAVALATGLRRGEILATRWARRRSGKAHLAGRAQPRGNFTGTALQVTEDQQRAPPTRNRPRDHHAHQAPPRSSTLAPPYTRTGSDRARGSCFHEPTGRANGPRHSVTRLG